MNGTSGWCEHPVRPIATAALVAVLLVANLAISPPAAAVYAAGKTHRERAAARAPNGPPLGGVGMPTQDEPDASPPSGGDSLVENGLGSPMCRSAGDLPDPARRSCEVAGFVAAPDPTGDFALDVNIDTGLGKLGNYVAALFQDFAGFGWMTFVSITHGLIVMFEWCYSLDLLTGKVLAEITNGLHGARISFTEPWLPLSLSAAAVLVVYHGLVRRRVAETLGQALGMLAMMAMGLWLIADPAATIGTLDHWADEAGLGTLAAVASGTPEKPRATFAGDMRRLFSATVGAPWCYLEFGNVDWCEGAGALDPKLKNAASAIARKEQSESGCRSLCGPSAGPKARALAASAALLREARSNGEMFLALPANEPARNSTKEGWSLLSVLCGGKGDPADKCGGPTAAQAEFRSEKGTQQRLMGVFLVWMGGLGMLLLFGYLALNLLNAALRTVFFLLLAPAAVLAPAFGEGGRALFRTWAMRLLAAVVSKLVFSFLLGVMLMMMDVLLHITVLGWLAEWFLLASFWWGAFFKRHQLVGFLEGAARGGQAPPRRSIARRVREALETPRTMLKPVSGAWRKLRSPGADVLKRRRFTKAGCEAARERADEQVARTLDHDHEDARERVRSAPKTQAELSSQQERLRRIRSERARALAEGDERRAARLGAREQRIEGEARQGQQALTQARRRVADGEVTQRLSGTPHTREQREERSRLLDEQAALPAAGRRNAQGASRDYAALAGLAGHTDEQYKRLDPRRQREARLRIDRELATRSQLAAAAADLARDAQPAPKRGERRKAERELNRALEQRLREEGRAPTSAQPRQTPIDRYLRDSARAQSERSNGDSTRAHAAGSEPGSRGRSPVMDDAFEVAARRKRQLGREPRE